MVGFVRDCAAHGVKAVSFGGGEPLQYPGVFDILRQLDGLLFRSLTTNGLLLQGETLSQLVAARPDKVHVSIHFPGRSSEVERVIAQVADLTNRGVRSGVNLLITRPDLENAREAAKRLRDAGIGNDRIVYLPMRGRDTPTPEELAEVAGRTPFQSMTCLTACAKSPRFASIGWDRTVAWCSYTTAWRPLPELTHAGLLAATTGPADFCGGTDAVPDPVNGPSVLAEADYPAAHAWTPLAAVDAAGHVALRHRRERHAPTTVMESLVMISPGCVGGTLMTKSTRPRRNWPPLGFFVYDYDEDYDLIGPFRRRGAVDTRPHDQLPPNIRLVGRSGSTSGSDVGRIQPLENFECVYWYEERVAYVAADGVTVRPSAEEKPSSPISSPASAEQPAVRAISIRGLTDGN